MQTVQKTRETWTGIDDYLTYLCLEKTIGEVLEMRERAPNAKCYFAAQLIFCAVFETDIGCIQQVVERVDGTIPEEGERDKFANIFGDALDDVLELDNVEQLRIFPQDPCIIAIAKATYSISVCPVGKNVNKKKDRQKAIEMILKRTGGRKSEPTRETKVIEYVDPEWMSLPNPE